MTPPSLHRMTIHLMLATALFGLSGCGVNNSERELNLGSVSIGQQLIDLQAAHEAGALSEDELDNARTALLEALHDTQCDPSDDTDGEVTVHMEAGSDDEDDEDNGWLF